MSNPINYILTTVGVDSDDPKSAPSIDYLKRVKSLLKPLEDHLFQVGMPPVPIVIRIESRSSATDGDKEEMGLTP